MNLSLVELYPLLPVAWIALLVALAVWARREPERRTLRGIATFLVVVTICVIVRAAFEARASAPGADYGSVRMWASALGVAVTLVVPAGLLGARSFLWASRRGASWGVAYGASVGIAILTSLVALALASSGILALAMNRA